MILFFHLIYLATHYILKNLTKSISKYKKISDDDSDLEEDDSSYQIMSAPSENENFIDRCRTYDNGDLRFFPPVYVQRYEAVSTIIEEPRWNNSMRKVVDFGCAELGFFMYLKNIPHIEEVLEVDIDEELLLRYASKPAPLTTDYLSSRRSHRFDVYLLAGSICDYDDRLKNTDAVIGIEIIEHLTDDVLKKMPYNIFHRIKPRLAIFTTPNAEFNVLFPNLIGFRHDDHKFEWTRKEFYDWAQDVITKYPDYSVKFFGIGAGPEGTENLGCCTQMAVFERTETSKNHDEELKDVQNYKLIREYKYPFYVDTRTDKEKIIAEVYSRTSQLSTIPKFYNDDDCISEIPLSLIMEYVKDWCSSIHELKNIIEGCGMNVTEKNNDLVVLYSNEANESDYSQDWSEEETNGSANEPQPMYEDEDWDAEPGPEIQMNKKISSGFWEDAPNTPSDMISQPNQSVIDFSIPEVEKSIQIFKNETEEPNEEQKLENLKKKDIQSKIPRKRNFRDASKKKLSPLGSPRKHSTLMKSRVRPYSSHIQKSPKKISKSCSLDSCLENINCESIEVQTFYLNLITNGGATSSINSCKLFANDLNSPIVDSEKAVDSGYPFSFSPHDADLTPEQVDELITENEIVISPKSSISEDSLSEENLNLDEGDDRVVHDVFVEDEIVENGDLANNNRDGEGNNVEGLAGERLINQIPLLADPNDNNILLLPEAENLFPDWLLNLVDLAQNPVV